MPLPTLLKYTLWMLPAVFLDISLWIWFQPQQGDLLTSIPLLFIVSIINLIAYHVFIVPQKVRSSLIDKMTGKYDSEEMEDLLDSLIQEVKTKQAKYDGTSLAGLHDLEKANQSKVKLYTVLWIVMQVCFFIWIAATAFYNAPKGFNLTVLYVEWSIGLLLVLLTLFIIKRKAYWKQESLIIRMCIDKCGTEKVFVFDDEF